MLGQVDILRVQCCNVGILGCWDIGMLGCWDVGILGSWDLGQVLGQVDIFAGASPSGHFRRCNWSTGNDLDT